MIWSRAHSTKERAAQKVQLPKKVEGMEAGMGVKQNWYQIQGKRVVCQMTVWGLGREGAQG